MDGGADAATATTLQTLQLSRLNWRVECAQAQLPSLRRERFGFAHLHEVCVTRGGAQGKPEVVLTARPAQQTAPRSVQRALSTPQVNPGSRYRCGKGN